MAKRQKLYVHSKTGKGVTIEKLNVTKHPYTFRVVLDNYAQIQKNWEDNINDPKKRVSLIQMSKPDLILIQKEIPYGRVMLTTNIILVQFGEDVIETEKLRAEVNQANLKVENGEVVSLVAE